MSPLPLSHTVQPTALSRGGHANRCVRQTNRTQELVSHGLVQRDGHALSRVRQPPSGRPRVQVPLPSGQPVLRQLRSVTEQGNNLELFLSDDMEFHTNSSYG